MVAYGLHDTMLTGNPQISFFKTVYRKHTHFYKESIEQTYSGDLTPNNKLSITLSKQGDLLTNLYLEFKENTYDTFSCIEYVECLIGDTLIDRHYSHWMNLWVDLTHTIDQQNLFNIIRRGTINYTIPELKDDYNPLFNPSLQFDEIRNFPLDNPFPIISMNSFDIFIYLIRKNSLEVGAEQQCWISRLTISDNLPGSQKPAHTLNGAFREKFVKCPVVITDNNLSSAVRIIKHKNKLYIADNDDFTGYIDVHTLDTNSNSITYGEITNSKLKLIGDEPENSEVKQFNKLIPYVSVYNQSFIGFYIGKISSICSNNDYILLSNQSAPYFIYKMNIDLDVFYYKYNTIYTYPRTKGAFGNGISDYSNGSAALSSFNNPYNIAGFEEIDDETGEYIYSDLYIADRDNNVIRRWNRNNALTYTVAGISPDENNTIPPAGYKDGHSSQAEFNHPYDLCVTSDGRYVIVADTGNYRIRKIDTFTNNVSTLAGSGSTGSIDGIGINTSFNWITSIVLSIDESYILVCDNTTNNQGCKIRKIILENGTVTTLVDSNTLNFTNLSSIAIEPFGNYALFIDSNKIYKLDLITNANLNIVEGTITLIAGSDNPGSTDAPNGNSLQARFNNPSGIYINNTSEYALISDTDNHIIRKLVIDDFNDPSVTTLTGISNSPQSHDGFPDYLVGAGGFAQFNKPRGLYINKLSTKAYIVDSGNNKTREIDLAERKELRSSFYIEQYTSQLNDKISHMVLDNNNNIYIIFDGLPGIYILSNPSIYNSNYLLIPGSDTINLEGNSLNIKNNIIYITCNNTNMVYTYNISTSVIEQVIPDNEDNDNDNDNGDNNNNNENQIISFTNLSGAIITYYNDIIVSEKGDSGRLKIIGKAKPYYIYHHIYDYQQAAYLPLQFWFCNSYLALPLISLGNTDVKINIKFSEAINDITSLKVWGDYIFLDELEKKKFLYSELEYLFTQVQHSNTLRISEKTVINNTPINIHSKVDVEFRHPIKELIWTLYQSTDTINADKQSCSETNQGGNQNIKMDSMYIQFNGVDRINKRNGKYFTQVQRYMSHSGQGIQKTRYGVNSNNVTDSLVLAKWFPKTINTHIYSFALKPEETQPSGSCNFSNLDSVTMNMDYTTSSFNGKHNYDLDIYGLNYNVLKIKNGLASLHYTS